MIKKVGTKYVLYSKSKKDGHHKRLGTFGSRTAAMKREKQIQYFKNIKENAAAAGSVAGAGGTFTVSKKAAVVKKGKGPTNKRKSPKMGTLQEDVLREAIRQIIFYSRIKYFEEQGKKELEEQKLRKIIRHLLSEKAEPTPFKSTGLNTAADVLQRIRRTVVDNYKGLTSSEEQRKNFIDTIETLVKQAVEQQDSMRDIEANKTAGAPVAGTEELEEQGEEAAAEMPITADEPTDPKKKSDSMIKQITSDVSASPSDTTGGSKAMPVVSTIVPQILSARDTLKDEADLKAFDLAILGGNGKIGNIKAFANIAEKELQATIGTGSTSASLSDELASDSEGSPADTSATGGATAPETPEAATTEPVGTETAGEETATPEEEPTAGAV